MTQFHKSLFSLLVQFTWMHERDAFNGVSDLASPKLQQFAPSRCDSCKLRIVSFRNLIINFHAPDRHVRSVSVWCPNVNHSRLSLSNYEEKKKQKNGDWAWTWSRNEMEFPLFHPHPSFSPLISGRTKLCESVDETINILFIWTDLLLNRMTFTWKKRLFVRMPQANGNSDKKFMMHPYVRAACVCMEFSQFIIHQQFTRISATSIFLIIFFYFCRYVRPDHSLFGGVCYVIFTIP